VNGDWTFRAEGVTKRYGPVLANDGISLHVEPGEVYGLLGPNGAGKSTLVKQVIGLLKPSAGTITLGPHDLVADPATARQLCSYLPQAQLPIDALRAREAIVLTGRIRGGSSAALEARADELLAALDITTWAGQLGARLSGGVKRLVGFAMATVQPGHVVILDEPTNDVDPLRRRLLWDQVRALAESGAAVFLVTHNVLEAEKAVDRLAIIDRGRVTAQGSPAALKQADRGRLRLQVMLVPGTPPPDPPAFLSAVTTVGHDLMAVVDEADAAAGIAWARDLVEAGAAEEYALSATTLEDVYIRLARDGAGAPALVRR
jgi:ABC-2 type transport system ATP-binding protein